MGKLLQLITKLFGKNALSKTLGTRTNVIKLPSNEKKRLIKDELNIEAASELAAQKVLKEAEDLIADIPRMNDQEVLTFTGNLQRLDNKLNPPSAEVVDITTKQPVTGEGLEQLAAREGLPADVSPDSPIGRVMQGAQRLRKEKDELDKMLKDPAKQLEQEMQNPYRSGGPLDPKMGIVRTAARQVLQKLAREGKINIADPEEAKAIIEGYQGGVDPVEVFRKTFGEEALGDLANLGDELLEIDNRGGSFKELKKILEDEGFFNLQQPKNPTQGMTDEELMKLIRDEDPEEFATGGRVGFNDGGYTFEQFLKDKQQVDKFMSIEELKREYKRMMELKKIRDQRDMVATGGRVGFQTGGPTDEGILSLEEAQKLNPGMFVDTTTYNPIPEDAANKAADEIAKVIMGTLGMDDDMTSRTFIFESYVMPKRKELMEDFGLTMKEADNLIREGMAKYRTNKATGGRVGYYLGGDVAYDATNTDIYGSSAITITPDTVMGPGGNQIQDRMGKPGMLSPIKGLFVPPGGFPKVPATSLAPNKSPGYGLGGVNLLRPGAQPEQLTGDALVHQIQMRMVQRDVKPEYWNAYAQDVIKTGGYPTKSLQEYQTQFGVDPFKQLQQPLGPLSRFNRQVGPFENNNSPVTSENSILQDYGNSDFFSRISTMDVRPFTFGGKEMSGSSTYIGGLRNYLDSIGKSDLLQLPEPQTASLQKQQPLSPLAATAYYSNGGRVGFQKGSPEIFDQLEMDVPYPYGHRVNYAYGSGLKLIQILQKLGKNLKTEIKKAVDDLIPSGDPKLDADMAVDNMLEDLNIDRDTIDQYDVLDAYGMAYDELKKPLLAELKNKPKSFPKIKDPTFDENLPFDNDAEKLAEIKMSNEAYDLETNAPDDLIAELKSIGLNKNAERLELKRKYPGIDENLLTSIVEETDSQKKAEVISTIEQAFELMRRGKSPDEILAIFKKATDRTKQAGGGLSYLSGF